MAAFLKVKQISSYIDSAFHSQDAFLEEVISSIQENGMTSISVSPSSGKLLTGVPSHHHQVKKLVVPQNEKNELNSHK